MSSTENRISITVPKASSTTSCGKSTIDREMIVAHCRRSALLARATAALTAMYDDPNALAEALETLENIVKFYKENNEMANK